VTSTTLSELKDGIRAALKDGRSDDAKAMLSVALDRWPDSYWTLMLRAEVMGASGAVAAALEEYRAIHEAFPDKHPPVLGMIRLLLQQDRLSEARAVFEDVVWPGAAPDDSKSQLITALSPRHGKLGETADFLEGLLARNRSNATVLTRLAVVRGAQRRLDEAVRLFDEAAAFGPLPDYAQAIRADLLLTGGRGTDGLALASELAATNPHRVDHTQRLILAYSFGGAPRNAALLMKQAATKWPREWRLLHLFNRMPPLPPLWQEIFAVFEDGLNIATADPRALFQFARASLRQGRTELALSALAPIAREASSGHMAKPLESALRKFSPAEWRARSRLADDPAAEFQFVPVAGADTTIVVFGGTDGCFSYLPFGHLDALISAYRANVIYLRDYRSLAYFEGVSSLAPNAEQTVVRLRDILERHETRRVITVGCSVGGFAAIRYGAQLGAQAAITFGAPTTLDKEFQADVKFGTGYDPGTRKRALSIHLLGEKDLIRDIVRAETMRVFVYYSTQHRSSVAHADRLRGLSNVELRPQEISDHYVALHAIVDDSFDRLVGDEIGVARN